MLLGECGEYNLGSDDVSDLLGAWSLCGLRLLRRFFCLRVILFHRLFLSFLILLFFSLLLDSLLLLVIRLRLGVGYSIVIFGDVLIGNGIGCHHFLLWDFCLTVIATAGHYPEHQDDCQGTKQQP